MFHRRRSSSRPFSILDQKGQNIVGGAPQNNVPINDPVVEALTAGNVDVMIG